MRKNYSSILLLAVLLLSVVGVWTVQPVKAATITQVDGPWRGTGYPATVDMSSGELAVNDVLVAVVGIYGAPPAFVYDIDQEGVEWIFVEGSWSGNGDLYNKFLQTWYGIIRDEDCDTSADFYTNGAAAIVDVIEYNGISGEVDVVTVTAGQYDSTPETGTTASTSEIDELWIGGIFNVQDTDASQSSATNGFTLYDGASIGGPSTSLAFLEKIVSGTGTAQSQTSVAGFTYEAYAGSMVCFLSGEPAPPEPTPTPTPTPEPSVSPSPTLGPIEQGLNFYYRGDTKTYGGETAYHMAPLWRGSMSSAFKEVPEGATSFTLSYDLYLLSGYEDLNELAFEVAEVTESVGFEGELLSQWECPLTTIDLGNVALYVDVCIYWDGDPNSRSSLAIFISDPLDYKALGEQIWTFRAMISEGSVQLDFGDVDNQSGIFGVEVLTANQYEIALAKMRSGDMFGGMIFPFVYVLHEAFYLLLMLMILVPMYVRYRHISIIILFFVLFGGAGSVMNWLIPTPFVYGAWAVVLFGMAGLLFKAVR